MVEATNTNAASGQVNIIVPNPMTERGRRVSMQFSGDGKYLIYGCKNNLIFKSIDENVPSFVHTDHKVDITEVT